MDDLQIEIPPTDMMRRRTPMPFCGRFLWSDTPVIIRTDSPAILRAAEEAGFVPQSNLVREPDVRWEIVREQLSATKAEDWECKVTVDRRSLFLSMGLGQWFVFDLETGDGAGFVVLDPEQPSDPNAVLYLLALIYNVEAFFRTESGRHR